MTLQDLIDRINMYRSKLNLPPIFVHSRPSSLGSGTTLEIRCGEKSQMGYLTSKEIVMNSRLLAKSTNGGALNWFLKGMLTAFQSEAVPSISNFNSQIANITRSNYTRTVED